MIIQFSVQNFLSFKEEVTINLASTSYTELKNHRFKTGLKQPKHLLKGAAIYGGNASGKTNLIKAIKFMQDLVVRGTYGKQKIWVEPFLLSKQSRSEPSRFDINLLVNGDIYNYGFVVNKNQVLEEWLFKIKGTKEYRVYERITNEEGEAVVEHDQLTRDEESKELIRLVSKTTRPNQLFINEAFEKNIKSIEPVMNWFSETLEIISAQSTYKKLTARATEEDEFINFISDFVNKVDTGIKKVKTDSVKIDIDSELSDFPVDAIEDIKEKLEAEDRGVIIGSETSQKILLKDEGQYKKITLKMIHHSDDSENIVEFDFYQESEGTQRLMHLLPILVDLHSKDKVVLIDELDRRMHPKLTNTFLKSFYDIANEFERGQLVFTTHDTNLLNTDTLRRDEIWFFTKQENGESKLKSLAEYDVRKDKKIDKGYLQGRYQGLPFIKE